MADSEKRVHAIMNSALLIGGDFSMPPKKVRTVERIEERSHSSPIMCKTQRTYKECRVTLTKAIEFNLSTLPLPVR